MFAVGQHIRLTRMDDDTTLTGVVKETAKDHLLVAIDKSGVECILERYRNTDTWYEMHHQHDLLTVEPIRS